MFVLVVNVCGLFGLVVSVGCCGVFAVVVGYWLLCIWYYVCSVGVYDFVWNVAGVCYFGRVLLLYVLFAACDVVF